MIQVACPHCQTVNRFDDNYAGLLVQCQQCNGQMQLPDAAAPDLSVSPSSAPPLLPRPATTSGMAIASLVLGIAAALTVCIGIGVILGVVGIVLGILALGQIRNQPETTGGRGMAVGGIITSAIALVLIPLMLAILLPALGRAREIANRSVCGANMNGIIKAMAIYSVSNDDQYPPNLGMLVMDGSLGPKSFFCPSESMPDIPNLWFDELGDWVDGDTHYVYLGAGKDTSVPAEAILLYEPLHHHDGEGINILFGDSHVQFFEIDEALELLAEQDIDVASAPYD